MRHLRATQVCHLRRVCRIWNEVLADDALWCHFAQRDLRADTRSWTTAGAALRLYRSGRVWRSAMSSMQCVACAYEPTGRQNHHGSWEREHDWDWEQEIWTWNLAHSGLGRAVSGNVYWTSSTHDCNIQTDGVCQECKRWRVVSTFSTDCCGIERNVFATASRASAKVATVQYRGFRFVCGMSVIKVFYHGELFGTMDVAANALLLCESSEAALMLVIAASRCHLYDVRSAVQKHALPERINTSPIKLTLSVDTMRIAASPSLIVYTVNGKQCVFVYNVTTGVQSTILTGKTIVSFALYDNVLYALQQSSMCDVLMCDLSTAGGGASLDMFAFDAPFGQRYLAEGLGDICVSEFHICLASGQNLVVMDRQVMLPVAILQFDCNVRQVWLDDTVVVVKTDTRLLSTSLVTRLQRVKALRLDPDAQLEFVVSHPSTVGSVLKDQLYTPQPKISSRVVAHVENVRIVCYFSFTCRDYSTYETGVPPAERTTVHRVLDDLRLLYHENLLNDYTSRDIYQRAPETFVFVPQSGQVVFPLHMPCGKCVLPGMPLPAIEAVDEEAAVLQAAFAPDLLILDWPRFAVGRSALFGSAVFFVEELRGLSDQWQPIDADLDTVTRLFGPHVMGYLALRP
eukprot:TRINITY_DN5697_c0_g2_i2.p1 TRINITY_DN5697_c0_g2~~TRINITY_DN5697_c0_g2_i2.p1  ORF type:complete len:628 (-),score=95.71 TRINITY_DN5697_c0_g2_i2:41-1924(-)